MKIRINSVLILGLFAAHTAWADVEFDVNLSPAGSFVGRAKLKSGTAIQKGDTFSAENVVVDLTGISTGISLRDDHAKKRLLVTEHPTAKLIKVSGANGQGEGVMEIRGQKLPIAGTYKVDGGKLKATFPVSLADLKITDAKYMGVGAKDKVVVRVELPIKSEAARTPSSAKKVKRVKK